MKHGFEEDFESLSFVFLRFQLAFEVVEMGEGEGGTRPVWKKRMEAESNSGEKGKGEGHGGVASERRRKDWGPRRERERTGGGGEGENWRMGKTCAPSIIDN